MFYYNNYEFNLIWNNTNVELDPASYSFSMRDSIHTFYSELTFQFSDSTGIIQDILLGSEDIKLELTYGIKNQDKNKCAYVFESNQLPKTFSSDSLGGEITFNSLNSYYANQNVISNAYRGRISDIIVNKVLTETKNDFNGYNVNDTGCNSVWYRPLVNQKDFIEQILLPNCYSNNSNESPFYCFINSNNEFCLRNYNSMFNTSIKESFKLLNYIPTDKITYIPLYGLSRLETGSLITKKYRNRNLYFRNMETGTIEIENDTIQEYPKVTSDNYLPILQESNITSYYDMLYKESEIGLKESFNGRKINSTKDAMSIERFIINVPFSPQVKSGDLIYLELPIKNLERNSEISFNYSGNYLVESSDHVWQGNDVKRGYSQFIVSRKFMKVPNNSLLKSKLIQAG